VYRGGSPRRPSTQRERARRAAARIATAERQQQGEEVSLWREKEREAEAKAEAAFDRDIAGLDAVEKEESQLKQVAANERKDREDEKKEMRKRLGTEGVFSRRMRRFATDAMAADWEEDEETVDAELHGEKATAAEIADHLTEIYFKKSDPENIESVKAAEARLVADNYTESQGGDLDRDKLTVQLGREPTPGEKEWRDNMQEKIEAEEKRLEDRWPKQISTLKRLADQSDVDIVEAYITKYRAPGVAQYMKPELSPRTRAENLVSNGFELEQIREMTHETFRICSMSKEQQEALLRDEEARTLAAESAAAEKEELTDEPLAADDPEPEPDLAEPEPAEDLTEPEPDLTEPEPDLTEPEPDSALTEEEIEKLRANQKKQLQELITTGISYDKSAKEQTPALRLEAWEKSRIGEGVDMLVDQELREAKQKILEGQTTIKTITDLTAPRLEHNDLKGAEMKLHNAKQIILKVSGQSGYHAQQDVYVLPDSEQYAAEQHAAEQRTAEQRTVSYICHLLEGQATESLNELYSHTQPIALKIYRGLIGETHTLSEHISRAAKLIKISNIPNNIRMLETMIETARVYHRQTFGDDPSLDPAWPTQKGIPLHEKTHYKLITNYQVYETVLKREILYFSVPSEMVPVKRLESKQWIDRQIRCVGQSLEIYATVGEEFEADPADALIDSIEDVRGCELKQGSKGLRKKQLILTIERKEPAINESFSFPSGEAERETVFNWLKNQQAGRLYYESELVEEIPRLEEALSGTTQNPGIFMKSFG